MTRRFFLVVKDRGKLRYLGIGNIATYNKGVIAIGTKFMKCVARNAKGDVTEEQVMGTILNHETIHWVLDRFLGDSVKTKISLLDRILGFFSDRPVVRMNASQAFDTVFDAEHHDMEMGV